VYSPALISQLIEAHVEELHRAAQTCECGRDVNRPPLSTLIKRASNRVFAGGPAVNCKGAPVHGFEYVGHTPAATLRSRS
jgi:hypothetical protein